MTYLPVDDLSRSVEFLEHMGFVPVTQGLVNDAVVMAFTAHAGATLVSKRRFKHLTKRELAPRDTSEVVVSLVFDERKMVDRMIRRAVTYGVSEYGEAQDYGTMYARGFVDFDGHLWRLVWLSSNLLHNADRAGAISATKKPD